MVVIRLARGGAKKRPFFNIVVADSREARDRRYIEQLGYFNPIAKGGETRLVLAQERVTYWRSKGAKPSDRVMTLIKQHQAQAAAEEKNDVADKKTKTAKKSKTSKSTQQTATE